MPRPKKPGAPEPKRRSRNGCWPCKARKVKCGEEHPTCINCQRTGEPCDYSIRLNWDGRRPKRSEYPGTENGNPPESPTQPQRPFTLINHAFPVAGFTLPETQKQQNTFTKLPSQIIPVPYDFGKRKHRGYTGVEDGTNMDHQDDSLCGTSILDVAVGMASPALLGHMVHPETPVSTASPRRDSTQTTASYPRPHKRAKSLAEGSDADPFRSHSFLSSPSSLNGASPRFHSGAGSISLGSPLTPAASSTYSEDDARGPGRFTLPSAASPEIRRLSVHSLLSGPPGPIYQHETTSFYGFDLGARDEDIDKNDDMNAISRVSPISREATDVPLDGAGADPFPLEFGFGLQSHPISKGTGGYYDKPVPIRIPRDLEPLPSKLQENPMNLLYFHHFLNHTARVLVPYDDPQSNPFRTILPQMAVKNDNLLSLLLAYSASHRARLLQQKEPEMRIALWVEDIFPALRQALNDSEQIICNANLATAIMLASLEIISPTAFGYDIPWQKHLSLARDLMKKRLTDLRTMKYSSREDQVCSFLWSWFAYLDVLGSLSGGSTGSDSSSAWLLDYGIGNATDDQDEIDCIMGFTTRCVHLLAQTAELARRCDASRIGPDHRVRLDWTPGQETSDRARLLEQDLRDSMAQQSRPCKHIHAGSVDDTDRREMDVTNEAFHWAGLVHLHRRVLGRPSNHPDVQTPVQSIISCMDVIRRGGTAETGFLFPMFTAGCDTVDEGQRTHILERFRSMETNGMTQVHKARRLMEKVWVTGQPWETLLSTEFIG